MSNNKYHPWVLVLFETWIQPLSTTLSPEDLRGGLESKTFLGRWELKGSFFFPDKGDLFERLFHKGQGVEIRLHPGGNQVHGVMIQDKNRRQTSRVQKREEVRNPKIEEKTPTGMGFLELAKPVSDMIRQVKNGHFQVIVLDEEVEGIKATDLVPIIKRINPKPQTVAMSSEGSIESMRRLRGAGIFYQAMQPLGIGEIKSPVSCAFDRIQRENPSEAPRPQAGASGKCRFDYRVGFPPRLQGAASSRLARESHFSFSRLRLVPA